MRGDSHVRFGGRAEETDRLKGPHRASARPNHYYASLLNRQGESVKVVQSRLGHASAQETLDTYSHLWPDSEHLTRRAVDAVLGGAAKRHRGEGTRRWAAQQALTLSLWSTSCGRSLFHGSLSISWKTLCPIW